MLQENYIAVAPMMDWTDRHCRFFHRLLAPRAHLYTEMVTTGAILHGDRDRFLRFDTAEQPVALQLGGSDPADLARCAGLGAAYGYDEINLNCGCPSDRVQAGRFGACLMAEPDLVAACVAAMADVADVPITVKCRIGIDDSAEDLFFTFVEKVAAAGCDKFIVHARQAWLQGLSPKENREVPPLRYDIAARLKSEFPRLRIVLNGGLGGVEQIETQLMTFDGVMVGRAAYQNPWLLAELSARLHDVSVITTREAAALAMIPYIERQHHEHGTPAKSITRHMLGLFNGQRGGRQWRRYLSENIHKESIRVAALIEGALAFVSTEREQAA